MVVTVEIQDSVTKKRVSRDVDLSSVPSDGRGFAIAIATDELVWASWVELALAPRATTPKRSAPPEVVRGVEAELPHGEESRLGAAAALEHFGGGQTHAGADGVVVVPLSETFGIDIRFGARGGWDTPSEHGRVLSQALSLATHLRVALVRAAPFELAALAGARTALLRLEGDASERRDRSRRIGRRRHRARRCRDVARARLAVSFSSSWARRDTRCAGSRSPTPGASFRAHRAWSSAPHSGFWWSSDARSNATLRFSARARRRGLRRTRRGAHSSEREPQSTSLVTDVALGEAHGCAVTSTRLYCWGNNESGELGVGDTTSREAPTLVDGSWLGVTAGAHHTCALDDLGRVACWGANERGQLGTNDRDARSVPALVSLPQRATFVTSDFSHTCALLSDATLHCWGKNDEGELGQGDAFPGNQSTDADALSPVVVSGTFRSVDAGQGHTCGIRLDGTLFCWGRNSEHELGESDMIQVRSPLQVGTDDDWLGVEAGPEPHLRLCARISSATAGA